MMHELLVLIEITNLLPSTRARREKGKEKGRRPRKKKKEEERRGRLGISCKAMRSPPPNPILIYLLSLLDNLNVHRLKLNTKLPLNLLHGF